MTLPVLYSNNLVVDSAFEYSMPANAESQSFALTQSSEYLFIYKYIIYILKT